MMKMFQNDALYEEPIYMIDWDTVTLFSVSFRIHTIHTKRKVFFFYSECILIRFFHFVMKQGLVFEVVDLLFLFI